MPRKNTDCFVRERGFRRNRTSSWMCWSALFLDIAVCRLHAVLMTERKNWDRSRKNEASAIVPQTRKTAATDIFSVSHRPHLTVFREERQENGPEVGQDQLHPAAQFLHLERDAGALGMITIYSSAVRGCLRSLDWEYRSR